MTFTGEWRLPQAYAPTLYYEGPRTGTKARRGQWILTEMDPATFLRIAHGGIPTASMADDPSTRKSQEALHNGNMVHPPVLALLHGGTETIWTDGNHRATAAIHERIRKIPVALVAVDPDGNPIDGPLRWPSPDELQPWRLIW